MTDEEQRAIDAELTLLRKVKDAAERVRALYLASTATRRPHEKARMALNAALAEHNRLGANQEQADRVCGAFLQRERADLQVMMDLIAALEAANAWTQQQRAALAELAKRPDRPDSCPAQ